MSLTVLAPAFYTDPEWSTRYLRRSAERHKVPVTWYGVGEPYRGWHDVQLVRLLAELRKVETTHVLYTDSSDAIVLTGVDVIEDRYCTDFGNPELLIGVEQTGDEGVNAGGWMGQTEKAVNAVDWLLNTHGDEYNPQNRWRNAVRNSWLLVERDVNSLIFQAGGRPPSLGIEEYQPCVWHACGGYTDPRVGKAALIEPVWRALGYEATCEVPSL